MVLACGGFEANAEMRTRYLGPGWDLAKVRGTRFNTGDGIKMALDDRRACRTATGRAATPSAGTATRRSSATSRSATTSRSTAIRWGIMVNANGERFVDEGADFRNYTYAKYGARDPEPAAAVRLAGLRQQDHALLRDEYRIKQRHQGARRHARGAGAEAGGRQRRQRSSKTIREYNAAVKSDVPFNPNVKDGRCTVGLDDPQVQLGQHARRSRRSRPIAVDLRHHLHLRRRCKIDQRRRRSIDTDGTPIPGLYAAGEMVGGMFYFNYPGGTGLMSGAVFGKIAGTGAASAVRNA